MSPPRAQLEDSRQLHLAPERKNASARDAGNQNAEKSAPRFIDLFAGIGGFRLAFEAAGGKCVFSSERDKFCRETYHANFGEIPAGDINEHPADSIPDHDLLCAGFPCQPFSLAGVSKKNSLGRPHGFRDRTQGTLFFKIAEILDVKRPAMFLLENVKNLKSHDKGRTFRVIEETLEELGYVYEHAVLDARHYVPQHRERVYIAGFDRSVFGDYPDFRFPRPEQAGPRLGSILDEHIADKYYISDHLWQWFQDYAEKHRRKGNGFGYGLVNEDSVTRTLSARYYKDGSEILVRARGEERRNPRRLTPRECARLMGYGEDFRIPVSDTQAYKQFGNSVVVPLISDVAREMTRVYAASAVGR